MITFLTELTNQFRLVLPESYHDKNRSASVLYPYLTYNFDSEALERNIEGFYIDVDIFDNNASYVDIFQVEDALKDHFKDNRFQSTHSCRVRLDNEETPKANNIFQSTHSCRVRLTHHVIHTTG